MRFSMIGIEGLPQSIPKKSPHRESDMTDSPRGPQ